MRPPRPNPKGSALGSWAPSPRSGRWQPFGSQPPVKRHHPSSEGQYQSFQASLLYCPKCRQATPTRERLLLVLPTGNLYEYLCVECGTSTGSKTDKEQAEVRLFIP